MNHSERNFTRVYHSAFSLVRETRMLPRFSLKFQFHSININFASDWFRCGPRWWYAVHLQDWQLHEHELHRDGWWQEVPEEMAEDCDQLCQVRQPNPRAHVRNPLVEGGTGMGEYSSKKSLSYYKLKRLIYKTRTTTSPSRCLLLVLTLWWD